MKLATFLERTSSTSTHEALASDFADAGRRVACWRDANQVTTYASTAVDDPISPLWLLSVARPSAGALKGVEVATNYCDWLGGRSAAEIGVMKLALDGVPKPSKHAKLPLAKVEGRAVRRIELTDALVAELKGRFKVPPGATAIVDDICSPSASQKVDGRYVVSGTHTVHRLYLATAYILLQHKHTSGAKDGVVALVVDKTGNIVSWGMKNPEVSAWHGETSALMALRGHAPAGGAVFSTLKPCKMCGGLIHAAGRLRAFYGQEDAGDDAKSTALDKDKLGCLLDAHKSKGVPHGLVLAPKGAPQRPVLGKELQDRFTGQKSGGVGSPIVYLTSNAVGDLMAQTQAVFQAKLAKYKTEPAKGQENTQNQRVAAAVRYLADFLALNGVKIT